MAPRFERSRAEPWPASSSRSPAGWIPRCRPHSSRTPATGSRPCSCPTGTRTTRATARPRRISRTPGASATNSGSRCTRRASRRNTARACSRTFSPNLRPGARRIPTCSATARSSSASGSTTRDVSAQSASPPVITRGSVPTDGSSAASMPTRTRAISSIRSIRRCSHSANFRSAGSERPRCVPLRASAACRLRTSATRPESASSASARSANSSEPGCRGVRGRSRPRTAPSSAVTAGLSATRLASAAVSAWADCAAPATRPGLSRPRTWPAMHSSSSRAPDTPPFTVSGCAR